MTHAGELMIAFATGGLLSGALGYRSGLRDGKARASARLHRIARQERQQQGQR